MRTDWLGLEQENIQNDHHSERRKGISNQEREGDTMEMESRSLESDILSFQIIRVKRVEKAKESSSNLLTPLGLTPADLVSVLKQHSSWTQQNKTQSSYTLSQTESTQKENISSRCFQLQSTSVKRPSAVLVEGRDSGLRPDLRRVPWGWERT